MTYLTSQATRTDLLCYWPWEKLAYFELQHVKIFAHDCSNKFVNRRLEDGGKTVWYVTVPTQFRADLDGALCLMGRLEVGRVTTDHAEATQYIQQTYQHDYPIRQSNGRTPLHLIARPGTAQPYALVPIDDLVPLLRFISKTSEQLHLDPKNPLPGMGQVQTVRWLTPDSIARLESRWEQRQALNRWRL